MYLTKTDENFNSLKKAQSIDELLEGCPVNKVISDNLIIAWSKINSSKI